MNECSQYPFVHWYIHCIAYHQDEGTRRYSSMATHTRCQKRNSEALSLLLPRELDDLCLYDPSSEYDTLLIKDIDLLFLLEDLLLYLVLALLLGDIRPYIRLLLEDLRLDTISSFCFSSSSVTRHSILFSPHCNAHKKKWWRRCYCKALHKMCDRGSVRLAKERQICAWGE